MMNDRMIKIWRFYDAPEELRAISQNGGDEDFVAIIPSSLKDNIPFWFFRISNDADQYPQPDGSIVIIGCHA